MKKLLTILGSLTLIASGGALVVACNGTQPNNNDKKPNPVNPSEKDPSKDPKDGNKPGDKDGKTPGENTEPKTPEKKPVKKPIQNAAVASANDTQLLFDETINEATRSWNKTYNEKIEKVEMDKVDAQIAYENAIDDASRLTGELLDTWHRMTVYENDQKWIKAEKERIDEIIYREDIADAEEREAAREVDKVLYYENAIDSFIDSAERFLDDEYRIQLERHNHKFDEISRKANEDWEDFIALDALDASANHTKELFDIPTNKANLDWAEKYDKRFKFYRELEAKLAKKFKNTASSTTEEYFNVLDTSKENEAWAKNKAEKEKLYKEKLYKEFTTSSANATEDYFKLLDEIHNREKKEEEWIKSEIEKIEKILKDEDFRDGIAKTIKDLFDAIEENKIAANKRELKEKLEEISDSVTDNSRAANGISNWIGVDKETRDYISSISDSILNNATAVNGNGPSED
ncbi:lipoprotein [Mycoplasma mycoides]|uniref:lipoprotein n=1 Tax=Mycoplasma mycoides TaxID=2102 RepID=UPI00223F12BD|nr:lipoprotein [Mycoplasma mycoides]QVJ95126.1 lipoprotein [Mycoplasma mycoides subsp. capri]